MQAERQRCLGVRTQGGPKAPPGLATPSGTLRGAILGLTGGARAGSCRLGGSRQLASCGQGKKQAHLPTRVWQEAPSTYIPCCGKQGCIFS